MAMSEPLRRAAVREAWPALTIFAWAAAIALVMSTEFLAQPFVWRSWTAPDILRGWGLILGDRLIVAAAIGICIVAAGRAPIRGVVSQGALFCFAVLVGAAAGEWLRLLVDPLGDRSDLPAVVGRIAAWTLAGAAMAGILAAWRSGTAYAATAEVAQSRASQMRQLTTATQLEALQRQIEPHFLFNTLATIKRLGRTDPQEGRRLLSRLLEFIAATLAAGGVAETTLGQELDLAKAYLDVCRARMGARLEVIWRFDPELRDRPFPSLMLGTLLENAIKHGLSPLEAGGAIAVSAVADGKMLEVIVQDTGVGVAAQSGAGIGLANLVARLRLLYGAQASFSIEPGAQGGVRATIRTPDARAA
jgi:LytS/YehU family sensor histidine kinase